MWYNLCGEAWEVQTSTEITMTDARIDYPKDYVQLLTNDSKSGNLTTLRVREKFRLT